MSRSNSTPGSSKSRAGVRRDGRPAAVLGERPARSGEHRRAGPTPRRSRRTTSRPRRGTWASPRFRPATSRRRSTRRPPASSAAKASSATAAPISRSASTTARVMPVECKASNSAADSFKRIDREAVGKARAWLGGFGRRQTVPVAVIDGVFNPANLETARTEWAGHRLEPPPWGHGRLHRVDPGPTRLARSGFDTSRMGSDARRVRAERRCSERLDVEEAGDEAAGDAGVAGELAQREKPAAS